MAEAAHSRKKTMRKWIVQFRPKRFQYLLCVLLGCVLVASLMGQDLIGRIVTAIVTSLAFVFTCVSTSPHKRVLFISATVASLFSIYCSLVLTVDLPPFNGTFCQASAKVIAIAFFLFAGNIIFRDVIKAGDVDVNRLCGSVCLYVMIGVVWGQFYQLCSVLDPGCFILDLAKLERHGVLNAYERSNLLNYFSYVTLSTLGYGDISPVSRITRTLAYSEALIGQIYLAILVSRLVGLHIATASTPAIAGGIEDD